MSLSQQDAYVKGTDLAKLGGSTLLVQDIAGIGRTSFQMFVRGAL